MTKQFIKTVLSKHKFFVKTSLKVFLPLPVAKTCNTHAQNPWCHRRMRCKETIIKLLSFWNWPPHMWYLHVFNVPYYTFMFTKVILKEQMFKRATKWLKMLTAGHCTGSPGPQLSAPCTEAFLLPRTDFTHMGALYSGSWRSSGFESGFTGPISNTDLVKWSRLKEDMTLQQHSDLFKQNTMEKQKYDYGNNALEWEDINKSG